MKYDQISFNLIDPQNLKDIADGIALIEQLTTLPIWPSVFNAYSSDNKVVAQFFKGRALEEDGVPISLAKLMAKAIRDAVQAGSNHYLKAIGAAVLSPDEGTALLQGIAPDITRLLGVLCSAYQVGEFDTCVPEIALTGALVLGIRETEAKHGKDLRPAYADPLWEFPAVTRLQNIAQERKAICDFAALYFREQSAVMLSILAQAKEQERAEIGERFGEAVFSMGHKLAEKMPDVVSRSVDDLGAFFSNPSTMVEIAHAIAETNLAPITDMHQATLTEFYDALSHNLLSPIVFAQLLFVGGIESALAGHP